MLHAPTTEATTEWKKGQASGLPSRMREFGLFRSAGTATLESRHTQDGVRADLQAVYGNQAVLRMLSHRPNGSLLQRSCSCGGECSGCKAKQHDSVAQVFSSRAQAALRENQLPPDVEGMTELPEDSLRDYAGSGTCQNGGASSACDPETGKYDLEENNNTCCTKGCTAEHEAEHKKDHEAWGCCKKLGEAAQKPGANKKELIKKYAKWRAEVSPITECHAYSHDVECADALAKEKDCADKGKDTDCCKDIADYKEKYGKLAKENCDKAPKKAAPCPF